VLGHQLVVRAKRFKLKSGANAPRRRRSAAEQQRLNPWRPNLYKPPPYLLRQLHRHLLLMIV
jgi:hypothetical protein